MSWLWGILILGILVLIHELGHFSVAKWCKVKVLEFWIFMGPKLFSWKRKETEYSFRILPIGGMVRMEGEEADSDDDRAFNKKNPWQRAAIIAAGPLTNIIFAFICFTLVISMTGYRTTNILVDTNGSPAYEAGLQEGDKLLKVNGNKISDPMDYSTFTYMSITKGEPIDLVIERAGEEKQISIPIKEKYVIGIVINADDTSNGVLIDSVSPDSNAQKAGIKAKDRILALNDEEISDYNVLTEYLKQNQEKPLKVTIQRGNEKLELDVTPTKTLDQYVGLGFKFAEPSFFGNIKAAFGYSGAIIRSTYHSFLWLFAGDVPVSEMSGPVGIVKTIGDSVSMTDNVKDFLLMLLEMAGFISLSLGIFNLIPFPALDGSKILIILVEGITRKKLKARTEGIISMIGLAILMGFMVFVTISDILKFF